MNVIIYCYTNNINGKKYYGQTINENQRKRNHLCEATKRNSQFYFHRAIRKYGIENFSYEIVDIVNENNALEKETKYIVENNTLWPNGYNEQLPVNRMTEGVRQKISEAQKKRIANKSIEEKKEMTRKMCEKNKGKPQTEYQKKKAADANSKWYFIIHPDGREEKIFNLRQFGRLHNVDSGNLSKYGKSKGFTATRIEE